MSLRNTSPMNPSASENRRIRSSRTSCAITGEYARTKRRKLRRSSRNCSSSFVRSNVRPSASITSAAILLRRSGCATMNPNSSSRIVSRFPSESIPRSPTKITRDRWNRLFKSRTTSATVVLSSVLPGKTWWHSGIPSLVITRPIVTCRRSNRLSLL